VIKVEISMPELKKSTIKKLKTEIRELMVTIPTITVSQLSKQLGRSYNLISYLRSEVEEENARAVEGRVEMEIAMFELLVKGLAPHLWNIIVGKKKVIDKEGTEIEVNTTPWEKISAIRTIVENFDKLFGRKFDAGIFSKKLGEVEVKNKAELLKVILDNLDESSRKQFVEAAERFFDRGD